MVYWSQEKKGGGRGREREEKRERERERERERQTDRQTEIERNSKGQMEWLWYLQQSTLLSLSLSLSPFTLPWHCRRNNTFLLLESNHTKVLTVETLWPPGGFEVGNNYSIVCEVSPRPRLGTTVEQTKHRLVCNWTTHNTGWYKVQAGSTGRQTSGLDW